MKRALGWMVLLSGCGAKVEVGSSGLDDALQGELASEINALVPAGLGLAFEKVKTGDGLVIRPRGWDTGAIPGRLKPTAGSETLGFLTVFATGTNCDGECKSKDWAKVSEQVEFAQFRGGGWAIEKDVDLGGGKLLVARQGDRLDIALARWSAGGDRYRYCRVTLDKPALGASKAFEAACSGAFAN